MKGRSLLAAIIIVIAAFSSFVVWQTGEQQRLALDDFGFFKKQQQTLVVQYGQKLLWLAPSKEIIRQVDFNELGLTIVGDYGFFSNGDLLVYHRHHTLSLIDNIKSYLRISSDTQINLSTVLGDDGFYRCQLDYKRCTPFGERLPLIERSFRVDINPINDTVFLADTSAHQLYKISQDGRVLASQGSEQFTFPNQLSLANNMLWLADTNHHRLVALSTKTENFAQPIKSIETKPNEDNQFPHQFVLDGDSIWVNIADNSMSNGLIQQYDSNGTALTTAQLAYTSDPMTMVNWQNELLVSDFAMAKIEKFNFQGDSLGLFTIPALENALNQRQIESEEATLISQYGQLGFSLTLILGFIVAWKLDGKGSKKNHHHSSYDSSSDPSSDYTQQTDSDSLNERGVEWLDNQVITHKSKAI